MVFIRLPDVCKKLGISRATLYRLIKDGRFPKSTRIADHINVWVLSDVEAWMEEQVKRSQSL